jgi:predicted DCC family thiol-disulfide oxidoreductase YuxK
VSQGPAFHGEAEVEGGGNHSLLLYDGLCGFCNNAVRWVIKHDHADHFRFAPQQSVLAANLLAHSGIDREAMLAGNSVYLLLNPGTANQQLLTRSDVGVNIMMLLGGRWRILGKTLRAIPPFLRNAAYSLFARNRYRFTRKYQSCPIPTAAERIKFLA